MISFPNTTKGFDDYFSLFFIVLAVHELWIGLQHANVLMNPLCQRLDRNYGIALLKKNMQWVIAMTLGFYWSREMLSMWLCMPYVSINTQYLIMISCGYHSWKTINVGVDAFRKYSDKLGILRLLIDYWHIDTLLNVAISMLRMFLQGFDTAVHFLIVRDLLDHMDAPSSLTHILEMTALVWTIHAVATVISGKSTASLMVEFYTRLSRNFGLVRDSSSSSSASPSSSEEHNSKDGSGKSLLKRLWAKINVPRVSEDHCLVCHLLTKPNKSNEDDPMICGPCGIDQTATRKVPDVVFLAHPLQLSSAFSFWMAESPQAEIASRVRSHSSSINSSSCFTSGSAQDLSDKNEYYPGSSSPSRVTDIANMQLLTATEDGLPQRQQQQQRQRQRQRQNNISDPFITPAFETKSWMDSYFMNILVGVISWVWPIGVMTRTNSQSYVPVDRCRVHQNCVAEVWLTKAFAYQYLFKMWRSYVIKAIESCAHSANARGVKVMGLGALNKAHFINNGGEDVLRSLPINEWNVKLVHGNTLTAAVVCETVRHLDHVKQEKYMQLYASLVPLRSTIVLLGATAKIGRAVVLELLGKGYRVICVTRSLRRFNDLVDEAIKHEQEQQVQQLKAKDRSDSHDVDTDTESIRDSQDGRTTSISLSIASSSSPLPQLPLERVEDCLQAVELIGRLKCHPSGVYWIIGKNDNSAIKYIPCESICISYAVPNPLLNDCGNPIRKDLYMIDGGVMRTPKSMWSRVFPILLPGDLAYACHCAAIVHSLEKWDFHELGEVDLNFMYKSYAAALKAGFALPPLAEKISDLLTSYVKEVTIKNSNHDNLTTSICYNSTNHDSFGRNGEFTSSDDADVVIIGAGASGLVAAKCILEANPGVKLVMLDAHSNIQGSWKSHYPGLYLTSRQQFVGLNGFPEIPREILSDQESPGSNHKNEITGEAYIRYLEFYANRFGLHRYLRSGCYVDRCEQSNSSLGLRWYCTYMTDSKQRGEVVASNLVIATGKSSIGTCSPELTKQLSSFTGRIIHARDIDDYDSIVRSRSRVLLIGMGNSCIDVSSNLLTRGAFELHISTRSLPPVLPREYGCLNIESVGQILAYLPAFLADFMVYCFCILLTSKLYRSKLPKDKPDWYPYQCRRVPSIDKSEFIRGVETDKIKVHGTISHIDELQVDFTPSNTTSTTFIMYEFDLIILCTGYQSNIDWLRLSNNIAGGISEFSGGEVDLVGKSRDAESWFKGRLPLNENNRGLYSVGYDPGDSLLPIHGMNAQAKGIARAISERMKH